MSNETETTPHKFKLPGIASCWDFISSFINTFRFHLTALYYKFILDLITKKDSVRCIL